MSAENSSLSVPNHSRKLWKTALLLAGSGLLGGIAFAFWNRKDLAEIQSRRDQPAPNDPSIESEEAFY